MLHFTTKDIVNRAMELADLENSDFITWSENMKLLDESYKKLYQETINVNDKYYLKKISLKDLSVHQRVEKEVWYSLPDDFYQLSSVHIRNSGTQIMKKAKTEDNSACRYDIIENCLVLYGGASSMDLRVDYYPVPKTLTLRNSPVTFRIEGTVIDVNGNKVLTHNDTAKTATATDLNTGASVTIDVSAITDPIVTGLLGQKKFTLMTERDLYIVDIATGSVTSFPYFHGKKDGVLIYFNTPISSGRPETTAMIMDEYGREYFEVTVPSGSITPMFTIDDNSIVYWGDSNDSTIKACDTSGAVIETVSKITDYYKLQIINGNLYYINTGVFCNDTQILSPAEYDTFYGFSKEDYDTGYGFSTGSVFEGGVMTTQSCFTDTQLDFPNNFYFSYLAYLLAIAYKQKQNADASFLIQRASEEFAQFLTSISRDTAQNNRIQNVYNGGNFYHG